MKYYGYDEMLSEAQALQRKYIGLIECETIGYSVCGRRIIMLRLGCGTKAIFISAGIHGRESINTPVLMRLISYYAEQYTGGRNYSERKSTTLYKNILYDMFNKYSFNIIPLVNPDGYMEAVTEYLKRDYKYNANGVDINRNFHSALWKPSEISGCYAGDQPETKALISAFKSHPSFMYIDMHSRGECIYYYRQTMNKAYNKRQYEIASYISGVTGYRLMPPEDEVPQNDTGGNSVHFYSEQFGMPAITIETVPDEVQFPHGLYLANRAFEQLKELFAALIDKSTIC